uniref:Uncharacterized protein n=1 Tax=Oryza glumipatula TaxID=40148 RepID=A0A0E0AHQ7_9ORYZ
MPWQVTAAPLVVTDGSEQTPSRTLTDAFHLSKADLEWFCVEVVAVLVVVITRADNAEGGGVRLGCGTGIDGDNVRGLAGDRPGCESHGAASSVGASVAGQAPQTASTTALTFSFPASTTLSPWWSPPSPRPRATSLPSTSPRCSPRAEAARQGAAHEAAKLQPVAAHPLQLSTYCGDISRHPP